MRIAQISLASLTIIVLLISGCAGMNEEQKRAAVVLGSQGASAALGQIVACSTPATLTGAVLGTIAGFVYLEVTKEDEETVVAVVEEIPVEQVEEETGYYVLPVETLQAPSSQETEWCQDTQIVRESGNGEKYIRARICKKPDNRWTVQTI